jgi:hypothetical protein
MTAKYPGTCYECGKAIKKGDDIIFWPAHEQGRRVTCFKCGESGYLEFQNSVFDEEILMPAARYNWGNRY